ncbi:serine/threonine protein kinase [Humibacillus sp. DSM 29435]|uniref:Stk1 family PASTA domain-containing Ser/Thr kinase n=1 Tax=Humibacillus sp. DSM 29435 TaxID=1869167 RepID=UPI0008730F74|nr:PASTA domain-containing protein [Humibacillus sp. DSM 29435]OFE15766.1 serine/threonine protein kinase [Humibacillus sp. DSM 29435]
MTSSVADALVGRVIDGRYRIISHLADGGMASVYVALDARLDREVAVKIMRPGLATDHVFVERFRAEARSAARLSHPNVVAVFDQGECDGDVFLAMELVEGKTLRDVIHEESPLTARESLAILEPILEALRAAHLAGIIHRDVKPENVIVRHDGEVKVADFGLARAITNQTTTSQTGVLLGTVSYLSPEQVERGTADQRSDVYAAGLVLFEMLTGRKAVTGETPIQIAYKHVHGSIPPPSSLVPTVPRELDDLVAEAVAVEPADRFASAQALLTALRSVRRSLRPEQLDRRGSLAVSNDSSRFAPPLPEASTGRRGASPTSPSAGREAAGSHPAQTAGAGHVADGNPDGGAHDDRTHTARIVRAGAASRTLPEHIERIKRLDRPLDAARAERAETAAGRGSERPAVSKTTALPIGAELPRERRRWPWWLAAALLVLGGGGAGWWFSAGPGASTTVPAVVGQQVSAADGVFAEASLNSETSEEFSETRAKGTVLRTSPAAGTEVSKQTKVLVVVSKGQERYAVPTLTGSKADTVAASLSGRKLKLGDTTEAFSETVAAGVVISQQPAPGASVRRDTPVTVVVSKGRQPIKVPAVKGLAIDAATAAITDAGLTAKRVDDANSDTVPAGQVITQKPAAGTLFRGQPVEITVSKGPVMVQVPKVVGRPVAEAEKALTDLGFTVKKEYPFGRLFDLVRVQSVEGGQSVRKGATIVLTIV